MISKQATNLLLCKPEPTYEADLIYEPEPGQSMDAVTTTRVRPAYEEPAYVPELYDALEPAYEEPYYEPVPVLEELDPEE